MQVQTWADFKKKSNSTERPLDTLPTIIYNCEIYEECSVLHPHLKLFAEDPDTSFTYAYISEWKRYYFITERIVHKAFIEIRMEVDVLGSYRADISELSTFVVRARAKFNRNLLDPNRIATPVGHLLESRVDSPFKHPAGGVDNWYIIQYTGEQGIQTVTLTDTNMEKLCQTLWLEWGKIQGMTEVYANAVDPFQYILNVQRTPVASRHWSFGVPENLKPKVLKIKLGNIETVQGFAISTPAKIPVTVAIPKPPDSNTYPYLKSGEFCSYSLRVPGVGWIPLPADMLFNADTLTLEFNIEPWSGTMLVDIKLPNSGSICQTRGQFTSPWGISSARTNGNFSLDAIGKAGHGVVSSIKELFNYNKTNDLQHLSNATLGAVSAVGAFADTSVTTLGGLGGILGLEDQIICQVKYPDVVQINNWEEGEPLQEQVTLGSLRGYVQCQNGEFYKAETKSENDMVNRFLVGGFYFA